MVWQQPTHHKDDIAGGGIIVLSSHEAKQALSHINPNKTTAPDRVLGQCPLQESLQQFIQACLTSLCNRPLSHHASRLLQSSLFQSRQQFIPWLTIGPDPSSYECFMWFVSTHMKSSIPSSLEQHQSAYRANTLTEDAVSLALHTALEQEDSNALNFYLSIIALLLTASEFADQRSRTWKARAETTLFIT